MRSYPAVLTGGVFSCRILAQASSAVNADGRTCLTVPVSRPEPDGHQGDGDHPQNQETQAQDRHEGDHHFLACAAQDRVDAQQAHSQPKCLGKRDGRPRQQGGEKVAFSNISARIRWLQPLHPVVVAASQLNVPLRLDRRLLVPTTSIM